MSIVNYVGLRSLKALAISGTVLASTFALSAQANAASITYTTDVGTGQFGFFDGESGGFQNTIPKGKTFTDTYNIVFDTDVDFNVSFTLTPNPKTGQQLNFTSVTFDGTSFAAVPGQTYTFTGLTGRPEGYDLIVQGKNPSSATKGVSLSYSGAIAAAAVPEPASWAMMIGGFGLVGGALRRRNATRTTVAYA